MQLNQIPRKRKDLDCMKTPSNICPLSSMSHSPAIVSRCGGPTPEELNICGICGSELTMVRGVWIAISDEQADAIRNPSGPSTEQMIEALNLAGWKKEGAMTWRSPNGGLFRGPAGAWNVMQESVLKISCSNCKQRVPQIWDANGDRWKVAVHLYRGKECRMSEASIVPNGGQIPETSRMPR